jgi:hypothetical protein
MGDRTAGVVEYSEPPVARPRNGKSRTFARRRPTDTTFSRIPDLEQLSET